MRPDTDQTDETQDRDALGRLVAEALRPGFEFLHVLDSGRMAHVYLAREPALQRLVAVKVLRPEVALDDVARARFEREARSAAAVTHTSIPAVYRVGRLHNGLPYIVQEYVKGRTLHDRLAATGPIEPVEARRILSQLAGALAAAHASGVIHRDVRPGNVILERDTGRAVLTDFGVAGMRESGASAGPRLTREGELLGDVQYASPEELLGEPVTEQADVYSLGVVGYEILTGTGPYGSLRGTQLVNAHLQSAPAEFAEALRAKDPGLVDLLGHCLAKKATRRPLASEIQQALSVELEAPGVGESTVQRAGDSILGMLPASLAGFVDELRRRRVYQVAAAYIVAAIFLLEGAGLVLDGLGGPDWVFQTLVAVTVVGFPIVASLAWIYELSAGRIRRTEPSPAHPPGSVRWTVIKVIGVLTSLGLAGVLGWLLLDWS